MNTQVTSNASPLMMQIAQKSLRGTSGFFDNMEKISVSGAQRGADTLPLVRPEVYRAWKIEKASRVLELDEKATEESSTIDCQIGLFRILLLCGVSKEEIEEDAVVYPRELVVWRTFVGTIAHLIFRSFVEVKSVADGVQEVPDDIKRDLIRFKRGISQYAGWSFEEQREEDGRIELDRLMTLAATIQERLSLPSISGVTVAQVVDLAQTGDLLRIACYYAIIVYLCGRPIARNPTSARSKRPTNLQDKYFSGVEIEELTGSLQMSYGAARMIGRMWEHDPQMRLAYFRPLLRLIGAMGSPTHDAIVTTVSLLAYSKMSHVKIIHQLLQMYPFVSAMPIFTREFSILYHDTRVILKMAPIEQKFAKCLETDQFKLVDGKALDKLTRLAADMVIPAVASGESYAVYGADATVMDEFARARSAYQDALGLKALPPAVGEPNRDPAWDEEPKEEEDA